MDSVFYDSNAAKDEGVLVIDSDKNTEQTRAGQEFFRINLALV